MSFMCRLIVAGLIFLFLTASALAASDRVALVIGNGGYFNTTPLPNPPNDATDMGKLLAEMGFDVIVGIDLDRRAMEDKIRAFGDRLGTAKFAVFFYAGHGMQIAGRNYLVPIDSRLRRPGDLTLDTLELRTVLDEMESGQRVNLIFLDACRDNPLAQHFASSFGNGRSMAIGQGLAAVQTAVGTMISYSTEPDSVARDGVGRNSPFTAALLRHFRDPGADVSVIVRSVRKDVLAATGGQQLPWDHSSLTDAVILTPLGGDIPQVALPMAKPAPAEPPAPAVPSIAPTAPIAAKPAPAAATRQFISNCGSALVVQSGHCVPKACPPNQIPGRQGVCYPRVIVHPAPTPNKVAAHAARPSNGDEPAPAVTQSAPVSSGPTLADPFPVLRAVGDSLTKLQRGQ